MRRLLVLALLGAALCPFWAGGTTVDAYCATADDLRMLRLTNDYRAANGLAPLALAQSLGAAAEHHSLDMPLLGTPTNHDLADGTPTRVNMEGHGYPALSVESHENIGWGFGGDEARMFAWFQGSAGHNANLLDPEMRAVGLAERFTQGSQWGTYWTMDFGAVVLDGDAAVACQGPTVTPAPTAHPGPTPTPKPCRGNHGRWCR